jgi:hypothetical protein
VLAGAGAETYRGRRLSDALALLQMRGMRIVFSSEIVMPEMRVAIEPRATEPGRVLAELLEPHGLMAEPGPGGLLQVVRKPLPAARDPRLHKSKLSRPSDAPSQQSHPSFSERVQVTAPPFADAVGRGDSPWRADHEALQQAQPLLSGDPLRAVHALPHVSAVSDFHNELSVRGSASRHIGIVLDGVATPWLQHTAYGRGQIGSVAMFGTEVIESANLEAGAHPQRDGEWLGGQLGLTVRQGSRDETNLRGFITGTSTGVVAEGPIGRSQRGSWLVAARQSYLEWPLKRRNAEETAGFGFGDVQAKLVYDVRAGQQAWITAVGGRAGIDGSDAGWSALANGANLAGMLTVGWRSTLGAGLILSQQAHLVKHEFLNKHRTGHDADRGASGEIGYRAGLVRAIPRGLVEAGAQVRRTSVWHRTPLYGTPAVPGLPRLDTVDEFEGTRWTRSAYVNVILTPSPRLVITPGLRMTGLGSIERPVLGRWILAEWAFRDRWTLNGSTGVSHQLPELQPQLAHRGHSLLRPERAAHAEAGIGRDLAGRLRVRVTLFARREADVSGDQRGDLTAKMFDPAVRDAMHTLRGSSHGIELSAHRKARSGLSGWASYSHSRSIYADPRRSETFDADFDQRHTFNVHGAYPFSGRAMAAVTFRAGSNFPVPGYLAERGGSLFAGPLRNTVRLPPYARLDARAQRTFDVAGRRVTLFVEVLNVLNRRNVGVAIGTIDPITEGATGFTELLLPRLPSAGLQIDF